MYMTEWTTDQDEASMQSVKRIKGVIAQLGERLPCTQEVNGSIPFNSTIPYEWKWLIAQQIQIKAHLFVWFDLSLSQNAL